MSPLPQWPGTPSFVSGQVLSACEHMNKLCEAVRYLLGRYQATQSVFVGTKKVGLVSSYSVWWTGAIRHRGNTLRVVWYQYYETIMIRVRYNSIIVYESGWITAIGTEKKSIEVDISGAGLTDGELYIVTVDIRRDTGTCENCWFWLMDVSETDSLSLPALPNCNDGDVLTADQWNSLSQYAESLYQAGKAPQPGYPVVRSKLTTVYKMVEGGIRIQSGTLLYQVWRKQSNPGEDPVLSIQVNGTTLISFNNSSTPTYTEENTGYPFPLAYLYYPYTGTLDLSSLGLVSGEVYSLLVQIDDPDSVYEHDRGLVDYIFQVSGGKNTSGWIPLPEWSHGDYAGGNTGNRKVKDIRDDLEWLGSRIRMNNLAGKEWWGQNEEFPLGLWFTRRGRYLFYYTESEKNPRLRYYADGWQEVGLPAESSDGWYTYDLEQLGLLPVGRRYVVQGCLYAIEDYSST